MRFAFMARAVAVGLYIVLSWVLLAVAVVAGGFGITVLFEHFYVFAGTILSGDSAKGVWAFGLPVALMCYCIGIVQAAMWFGKVPALHAEAKEAQARRARPEPVPEHEVPKTRPSPDEIMKRGMPRG